MMSTPFGVSPVQIDIMTACKGITFDEAYQNSQKFIVDRNIPINVVEYSCISQSEKSI